MKQHKDHDRPPEDTDCPNHVLRLSTGIKDSNNLVEPWTDVPGKEGICHLEDDISSVTIQFIVQTCIILRVKGSSIDNYGKIGINGLFQVNQEVPPPYLNQSKNNSDNYHLLFIPI